MYSDCFNPMGIAILQQNYDKKKNKFSVNFRYFFRINFVKKVRFFQGKIKTEGTNETEKVYNEVFEPMVKDYLSENQKRLTRPVPKTKKKLTKSAKLKAKMEDMEESHKEEIDALKKDYDKQISTMKSEITTLKAENDTLKQRTYIIIAVVVSLVIFYKILF